MKKIIKDYYADKLGNIYSKRKFSKLTKLKTHLWLGYYKVKIANRTRAVHRVIAETFILNPQKKRTVNHKNGIKSDNRVANLEWNTPSENSQHSYDIGIHKPYTGYKPSRAGVMRRQSKTWKRMNNAGISLRKIGRKYRVNHHTVKLNITKYNDYEGTK